MTSAAIIRHEALRLWSEREATLPRLVRRAPDALDVVTGAWGDMVERAELERWMIRVEPALERRP